MTNAKQKLFPPFIVDPPTDLKPETLEMTRLEKNPAVVALRKLVGNARSSSPKKKDKR